MKKYGFWTITSIVVCLFVVNFDNYAQTTFSISDCISSALKNDYDMLLLETQKQYDEVLKKSAWGAYMPNISATAQYSRYLSGADNVTDVNTWGTQLNANLSIYDGGKREYNYELVNNQTTLTDLQKKYLIERIKLNVYSQYLNVLRLEEITKAREEDIKVSRSQLENFQAKYEAGIIPEDLVLSQEAELGNKEIQLLDATIAVHNAKQTLLITMGLDPTINATFSDSTIINTISENDIQEFRGEIGDIQNSIVEAFSNRIDYHSQKLTKENANISRSSANSNYYPSLSAFFNYGLNGTNFNSFSSDNLNGNVGINLSIPIFNNYNTDLQYEQSELTYQQQNAELLRVEDNIKSEVQTAYLNLDAAEKSIIISNKSLIAAHRNFNNYREKMSTGMATITDYITANTQYITAQINKISASYIYLNVRKNLLFSIGKYEY